MDLSPLGENENRLQEAGRHFKGFLTDSQIYWCGPFTVAAPFALMTGEATVLTFLRRGCSGSGGAVEY
ncbi:hypothetical protein, partial [Streptomyces broussonetiae]|uniref:hypothetical protein n=1 Tax=Streptomyces broussonetiae TaxID=2686304 RepID=UPI0035DE6300